MSDEKDNITPENKPAAPKPVVKTPILKKPAHNPFATNNNKFTSSKAGNPGNKGKSFKGGGVKKGK
jgi:hypothetical protein